MKRPNIEVGEIHGERKIIEILSSINRRQSVKVECKCGNQQTISYRDFKKSPSCRKCNSFNNNEKRINILPGDKYNMLTVIREVERKAKRQFECQCDCGTIKIIQLPNLVKGRTKSCGCYKESTYKHIQKSDVDYANNLKGNYKSMIARCTNQNHNAYGYYGGRGIKICDRWLDKYEGFNNFVLDMGMKPSPTHSIDRIDVNGDYEPSNCRWATPKEQANNKRPIEKKLITTRKQRKH